MTSYILSYVYFTRIFILSILVSLIICLSQTYYLCNRSKGVEIRGFYCTPMVKKSTLCTPVLEKHVFVPFNSSKPAKLEDVLRINIQLVQENLQAFSAKFVELVDEEYKNNGYKPLIENVANILQDHPVNKTTLSVVTEDQMPEDMLSYISISNKLEEHKNVVLIIGANLCNRANVQEKIKRILGDAGFILSREGSDFEKTNCPENYNIITVINVDHEYLVLLRKKETPKKLHFVEMKRPQETFSWFDDVKNGMSKDTTLVVYSEDEHSGLVGLINCLTKEPGGEKVRGVLIKDRSAPTFDANLEFYKEQLEKDLAINIFEDGHWGTYRHLLLTEINCTVPVTHAYNNVETIGDLSSLKWYEGSLDASVQSEPELELVHVYCAALNFRDIMTATGRVAVDAVCHDRLRQDCVQGLEVAGRTSNGTRVIAMSEKGISNMTLCARSFIMAIPDEWSFEEAATVFVAYSTVFTALIIFGQMKRGESVLIHAGTGGVGQAAINVALYYGCEVFTTVGTPEKRDFIKKLFPQLKDSHIGCSRDTSFEEMIQRETKGKGVDVVLNSLAEDKLLATTRCLAHRGRFLEIGKFDIFKNTQIEMYFHQKEIYYRGVMLDFLYEGKCALIRQRLLNLITTGIASGAVRPLTYCTFEKNEVESAFRYMAAGKHIGKVIIKIRDEEPLGTKVIPTPLKIEAVRRYSCHPDKVYILVGGLGGFGLELADWLTLRGARKIVFVSRNGVTNGYQSLKIRRWRLSGITIKILTQDVTTESGCEEMLKMANSLGCVEAVFHLAVVLKDATLENQTCDTFKAVYRPKVSVAINLDKLTRTLCPELKDFVLFSSYSCGRGNPGQSNYGFANSVMEKICEKRKKEGLPALAIQWGAIGDVGILYDMLNSAKIPNIQIGIMPQGIGSCLQTLDKFLKQDDVVVSSYIPAEKTVNSGETMNAVDTVAKIMGIKDLKTISRQTPLAELGMDSMVAMEIKQTLERDFEIILNPKEIRTLTFARLIELSSQQSPNPISKPLESDNELNADNVFRLYFNNFGDESIANKAFIYMTPKSCNKEQVEDANQLLESNLFIVPGLESCASTLAPLCQRLETNSCVLQLGTDHLDEDFTSMVDRLYQILKPRIIPDKPFNLLGYSMGTLLVLKLAERLESEGLKGTVYCIDGAPEFIQYHIISKLTSSDANTYQNNFIRQFIAFLGVDLVTEVMAEAEKIESLDQKIDFLLKLAPKEYNYSLDYLKRIAKAFYYRIKCVEDQTFDGLILQSPIVLIRPEVTMESSLTENYGLDKFTHKDIAVHCIDGTHLTILDNVECANIINKYLKDSK